MVLEKMDPGSYGKKAFSGWSFSSVVLEKMDSGSYGKKDFSFMDLEKMGLGS